MSNDLRVAIVMSGLMFGGDQRVVLGLLEQSRRTTVEKIYRPLVASLEVS